MAHILIIGCGAIGQHVAINLIAQGHQVTGLKRTPPQTQNGITYFTADITQADTLKGLNEHYDLLLFIVSASDRSEASYHDIYETGLTNVLTTLPTTPCFFISSTSVYGENSGAWVNEDSPTNHIELTSQFIVSAEQRVTAAHPDNVIIRFSGIYGAGRHYLLTIAQFSPEVQRTPPYYTNRIHQQDCVNSLLFLINKRLSNQPLAPCYLASDNAPAPMWEVMSWLTKQMNCPAPTEAPAKNPATSNKRCDNQRLKDLGYTFSYPSYQEGYREQLND